MRAWSSLRQFAFERLTIAGLALALAALAVVPGGTSPGAPHDPPCDAERRARASALDGADAFVDEVIEPRTGIDLEVRVLNLRVEFPWMRALPVSPGHHIVISLLARESDDRRP
jgi:hypothetical protein